ncbi:hypothetical protein [Rhodococcus jostii]|nr:hypothetical protein [Rhodococcus jostii]
MKDTFDRLPASWRREIRILRTDCKMYRLRLRAAEQRIAELEASRNV